MEINLTLGVQYFTEYIRYIRHNMFSAPETNIFGIFSSYIEQVFKNMQNSTYAVKHMNLRKLDNPVKRLEQPNNHYDRGINYADSNYNCLGSRFFAWVYCPAKHC